VVECAAPPHGAVVFKCWFKHDPKRYCYVCCQTAYSAWNRAAVELKVEPQQVRCEFFKGDEKRIRKPILEP
jgi:hypothetical protein